MPHSLADNLLNNPLGVIEELYSKHAVQDVLGFVDVVKDHFEEIIKESQLQVPFLQDLVHEDLETPRLVRFRCMVQDTGLGNEVFVRQSRAGKCLMFRDETEDVDPIDYSELRERLVLWAVSIPGQTEWARRQYEGGSRVASSSINAWAFPAHKFPVDSQSNLGAVIKLYEEDQTLRPTEVVDLMGVLSKGQLPSTSLLEAEGEDRAQVAQTFVPCIHVISKSKFELASSEPGVETVTASRTDLIDFLAEPLGHDRHAGEFLLLALLAKTRLRQGATAIGQMALNIVLPAKDDSSFSMDSLESRLAQLVPGLHRLQLDIPSLKDPRTRIVPESGDGDLSSGILQTPAGSVVLIDETLMKEGELKDKALRSLKALSETIGQQKVEYIYPFSSFQFDSDISFLIVSRGKSLLPCSIALQAQSSPHPPASERAETDLSAMRAAFARMRSSSFQISEEMSNFIQSEFVRDRQNQTGGDRFTQEDLMFRMSLARLLAQSLNQSSLDVETWQRAVTLDLQRKERNRTSALQV